MFYLAFIPPLLVFLVTAFVVRRHAAQQSESARAVGRLTALMLQPKPVYWRRDLKRIDKDMRAMFDTYILRHFGDGKLDWLPLNTSHSRQLQELADQWVALQTQPDLAAGGKAIISNHVERLRLCAALWRT